jgi:putative phosphoesterase
VQLAIISDTHLPRGARALPEACVQRLRSAQLIIHAGDFVRLSVLRDLQALGPPVVAVHGNVDDADVRAALPETAEARIDAVRVGVIHDAGPRVGRLQRMRTRFPGAAAVVFGHSHLPLHERGPDGFQIFNPGSPTDRRRAPVFTMGIAEVTLDPAHPEISFELVEL